MLVGSVVPLSYSDNNYMADSGYDGAAASSAGAELNAGELPEAMPLHGEQQQQQQPALSFSTR